MRHLSDADVEALLPPPAETVRLVHEALVALAKGEAEVPPKPTVHAPGGAFANAMPAAYPPRKLLGCKWISIYPDNPSLGLPTASGLMVVNDGETGVPRAVMSAGGLTAARTAAVSGACIAALASPGAPVAFTGAGVQARSHLRVLAALGHHDVTVYARRPEARDELLAWAAEQVPQVDLQVTGDVRGAVEGRPVIVTALSIGLSGAELDPGWVAEDALVLPLDYASSVGPVLAGAATLAADHLPQFEAVRAAGTLGDDYPQASRWTGELLDAPRPEGRVVCQNLGNGLGDLVVAAAVADTAEAQGAGQVLATGPA
jgi:ornithine cyclodeaminase/alanine dehydrogenase-like protein (mu-crystallin family)